MPCAASGWLAAALLLAACDGAEPPPPPPPPVNAAQSPAQAPPPMAMAAPEFPERTGRVVDQAQLLAPATEAQLTEALAALERRTSDQLVIVTLTSLGGHSIERYSQALGNRWGVGQDDKDNGVLLVVAPNERRVRIAVGYGLLPILTEARASEIVERDLVPALRDQRFDAGVTAGAAAIIRILTDHADEPRRGQP